MFLLILYDVCSWYFGYVTCWQFSLFSQCTRGLFAICENCTVGIVLWNDGLHFTLVTKPPLNCHSQFFQSFLTAVHGTHIAGGRSNICTKRCLYILQCPAFLQKENFEFNQMYCQCLEIWQLYVTCCTWCLRGVLYWIGGWYHGSWTNIIMMADHFHLIVPYWLQHHWNSALV